MNSRIIKLLEFNKIKIMLKQHAASVLGQEYVERIMPVRDIALVQSRLEETSQARALVEEHGVPPLSGLHDVREAVMRAKKLATLTALELLDVSDTAACCRRLRKYITNSAQLFPRLLAQGKQLGEFLKVEKSVDQAIAANGEVLDSASPELARARKRVRAMHDEIHRELQRIISSTAQQDFLQDPIVTQRNSRYCVPVRAESRNAFKGIVHDLSASGQTVFMEPLSIVELGNDLREAQQREEEELQRVLAAISAIVGVGAEGLLASIETAARLDLIFARASFAGKLDAVEPKLSSEGIISLQQARHPLLGPQAVPIDMVLGQDGNRALLITGPNTGGKTVTLKTVGLLTLMAQSGMHIPALPGSCITVFDEVFADIGDEQSIEQSLSTFSGHMTNIVNIIKHADAKALVLLDEIGAGTDPAEGAALGKAVLLELYERGCHIIATTHYGELKVFGQHTPGFFNASVEFDLATLRPTFRVITGLPGSSNALAISQRLGLSKSIIARAKTLMGEAPQAYEQVLKEAEGVRRALDRERSAAGQLRREAETSAKKFQHELQELEEKRDVLLGKARQQALEIVQKSRQEANELLDQLRDALRQVQQQNSTASPAPVVAELRRKSRAKFTELTEEANELPQLPPAADTRKKITRPALQQVIAGQTVLVKSLGHKGIVLSNGRGTDEVEVQVGIMRVTVPISDLEARSAVDTSQLQPPLPSSMHMIPVVEKELHLLGKRAEEATQELDSYLYDALEHGLEHVRIVHGFGTGALRQVVQNLLRHHPAVQSYRAGQPDEGGGGVTIADLGSV